MLFLNRLELYQFKNFTEKSIDFTHPIVCFIGDNGVGKTSLLDAIHFLSVSKSAFNSLDSQCIQHGQTALFLRGFLTKNQELAKVEIALGAKKKKQIKVDGVEQERLVDFVGTYPSVLIAPDDTYLISEGGEERRRFFDVSLSQSSKSYLLALMHYNAFLKERNSLLKQLASGQTADYELLATYDERMLPLNKEVASYRQQFVEHFVPLFAKYYHLLSAGKEEPSIQYRTNVLEPNIVQVIKDHLRKDLALERTHVGVHRDDFLFELDGHPLKVVGSQGQCKTFVIALKLAQYAFLKQQTQCPPLLLLDDIFDKLDEGRIKCLLDLLVKEGFGQVFITDAREERSRDLFLERGLEAQWLRI